MLTIDGTNIVKTITQKTNLDLRFFKLWFISQSTENKTKKSSDKAKDDIIIKIDESLKKYDVSDLNTQIDKVFS